MADVYLSPTMRRLVAKYGNKLEERQGMDPAIIAYDLGLHEGDRADNPTEDGPTQLQGRPKEG